MESENLVFLRKFLDEMRTNGQLTAATDAVYAQTSWVSGQLTDRLDHHQLLQKLIKK